MGASVALAPSSDVYVAGYTTGSLDGNTLTGTRGYFLTKYDSSGNKLFTKQLGVSGANTAGMSVTTDSNSDAYVAGSTYGILDGNSLAGTSEFFIFKCDSSGNKK